MPLDPLTEKILLGVKRAQVPQYHHLGAQAARAHYEMASQVLEIPEVPMDSVLDHPLALPGRTLTVRQYTPRPVVWSEPTAALLFFHGGGFTIGSIRTHDRLCRALAAMADCQVFSVDYRLAPEHKFPAAHQDAFDSLAWLLREAEVFGVDRSRLAVGGDSAGGTLAATTAIHARDHGITLSLQMLFYPGTSPDQRTESHRRFASGYLLDAPLIQWFFENYLESPDQRRDWRFAPLECRDLAGLAPAWMALAEYDPLLDEGLAYAKRLREAGVPCVDRIYPGVLHAFLQHGGLLPVARSAQRDAAAALRAAFDDRLPET